MSTVEFDPSLLGTKDHWDQCYSEELAHFYESGLEGEVWFGEGPVVKMVDWALTHVPLIARPNVLDVGAGNGLLLSMVEAGYDPSRLTGMDYSHGSVDLCIAIAKQRNGAEDDEKHACENATFAVCDFLDPESPVPPPREESTSNGVWDLVLDKGTFDAISLMDKDEPGGYFLITSCNFTEDELTQRIATQGSNLEYKGSVPYTLSEERAEALTQL